MEMIPKIITGFKEELIIIINRKEGRAMEKRKFLRIGLWVVLILTLIYILISGFLLIVFGKKIKPDKVVKEFEQNIEAFTQVNLELQDEEQIYFEIIDKQVHISTIEDEQLYEIKTEEFYKYEKTLELMKKLDIISIEKDYDNIDFQFNAMINFSQDIVNLKNDKMYRWGHHILKIERINDEWYYVERE